MVEQKKHKDYNLNDELTVVGVILILVVLCGYLVHFQNKYEAQKIETLKAQKIAVEIYEEKKQVENRLDIAHENLSNINRELDKYEQAEDKVKLIIKELATLETNTETMSVLVLFTESSGNKNVKHPKKTVRGRCGVDVTIWGEELKENGIPIDSLKACDYILNKYLEENNGNKKLALYGYKGVENNTKVKKIVDNMIKIEKKIEKELK